MWFSSLAGENALKMLEHIFYIVLHVSLFSLRIESFVSGCFFVGSMSSLTSDLAPRWLVPCYWPLAPHWSFGRLATIHKRTRVSRARTSKTSTRCQDVPRNSGNSVRFDELKLLTLPASRVKL